MALPIAVGRRWLAAVLATMTPGRPARSTHVRATTTPPTTPPTAPLQGLRIATEHATARVPMAAPGDTVAEVLAGLRGRRFDDASIIVVNDGDILAGVVTLEHLVVAPDDAFIRDVMDPDPPVVAPDTDQEYAAWSSVHRDESALVVVDDERRFIGIIPPDRMMAVLLAEHDEDMARLAGFLGTASVARAASSERVRRRLWHRLPWLLIGLTGAMLSAAVVGAFEATLQRRVLLAFFVPAVVYLADAVGTQTVTLVVRGLSVGVPIGRVVRRELITGVVIGVLLGSIAFAVTSWLWGDVLVATAVGIALTAACSIATVVAMTLPWLLSRLGVDPAYGSGPVGTVIQDLLSIAIYLATATVIVG